MVVACMSLNPRMQLRYSVIALIIYGQVTKRMDRKKLLHQNHANT
jgi:hypothetical protein